ncbi:hypothetical protein AAFF_G00179460 [Aldrovandia affinis]|uniref:Gypsy retrotransposon integrase-like protein 1 n=1 Tax=Aldrovandia affinis TaxID=143900 RepID=A0AAD7RKS9_9TELE|nr:hypothetical protein AAFF_G00179460 [Aldrovandia affinis]
MKLGVLKIGVDVAAVVDKQSLEQQYPKLFQGVGKLNSKQVSLHINPEVKPVAQPLRRIPFNLRGAVEAKFTLVTDHKPLEVIYGPHSKPCARIERWVLRLQPYDFKVKHIPGKRNIADPLSRLLGETAQQEKHHHGSDEYVRFVAVSATPKALTTREVEEASATDPELIEVRKAITNGRFENCKAYAAVANELCVVGYLVLRGTRIVLPHSLHARALTLAHEGHLGIVGTKQHLRTKVWWPGMDRAAEKHCKECHGCQIVSRPDPPELLRPTPLPDGPMDLA